MVEDGIESNEADIAGFAHGILTAIAAPRRKGQAVVLDREQPKQRAQICWEIGPSSLVARTSPDRLAFVRQSIERNFLVRD